MKKFLFFFLAIIFSITNCTKSCDRSEKAEKAILRIGTNANFPPFEYIDTKGKLIGFDIAFGEALAKKLNLEASFKELEFDALILGLKKNQIDIILSGLSITTSRLKEISMIPYQGQPLSKMALLFWEEAPAHINNIDELKNLSNQQNLKLTVQAGHYLENFLRDENINLKPLAGPPEQILDIKYKKSWAAVLDVSNAEKLVATHPQLKILIMPLPEDKWDLGYGVGISKNNPELSQKITKAIQELKSDGTMAALEKIWLEGEH